MSAGAKGVPLTPPSSYVKSGNSKRISQLLAKPPQIMNKSPNISQ
jgi:hypothetical protein